ncbi:MAG TPA: zinc-binding dehydrogenase [Polyangia bacterium]|jgi:NADPH2:quinone reductase|nr:zinc-binding dehydrogenase [Polyangia bacterium]
MKAIRYHRYGGPEVLQYEDVPDPAPAPGEVEVRVRAVSVSPINWKLAKGIATVNAPLPQIPGSECAGETPDGRRVVLAGGGYGTARPGVYAEKITALPAHLVDIPEGVSFAEAASLGVAYATAQLALVARAGLQKGESVAVLGATGGVGVAALQLARLAGASPLIAVARPESHETLRRFGADVTLDPAQEDLGQAIARAAGGGANVILDPVAGPVGVRALAGLAPWGRQVVLGTAAGDTVTFSVPVLYGRNASLLGFTLFGYADKVVPTIQQLLEYLATRRLVVPIERTLPLSQAADAWRLLQERGRLGKIILVP